MAYSIVELQTDTDGTTAAPAVKTEKDYDNAKSLFHQTCVYSAISRVYLHVVLLLDERGKEVLRDESVHAPPPPPEPEPEPDPEPDPEPEGETDNTGGE